MQPSETVKSLLSECISTEPECNVLSEGKAGESKNGSRRKYILQYINFTKMVLSGINLVKYKNVVISYKLKN